MLLMMDAPVADVYKEADNSCSLPPGSELNPPYMRLGTRQSAQHCKCDDHEAEDVDFMYSMNWDMFCKRIWVQRLCLRTHRAGVLHMCR